MKTCFFGNLGVGDAANDGHWGYSWLAVHHGDLVHHGTIYDRLSRHLIYMSDIDLDGSDAAVLIIELLYWGQCCWWGWSRR